MRILIDTNILLDVLMKREQYYLNSAKIWTLVKEGLVQGYISALSINNLYYIIKKMKGQNIAEEFVDEILNDFEIIPLSKDIFKQSRTIKKLDFEDIIQYFSALNSECSFIITRNKKDFPTIGIKIFSPDDFLDFINKEVRD